jgi:NAD(P)-dependent dehydrogenase (short-subunit alcohol dehydrogenase family)
MFTYSMTTSSPAALVTGAATGIGRSAVLALARAGYNVALNYSSSERAARETAAAAEKLGAKTLVVRCDVSDEAGVRAMANKVEETFGRLDVLINNAGIAGSGVAPLDVTADDMRRVYETNVFGLVRVTHAALPLLNKSERPVIVNVASGLGSLGVVTDPQRMESQFPTLVYGSSKSAVVALTVQYAKALPAMRVNVADPGYTATDLNANRGTQTLAEGTDAIVTLATVGPDGPTGGFFDRFGSVPW